jgi:hypothetical protein
MGTLAAALIWLLHSTRPLPPVDPPKPTPRPAPVPVKPRPVEYTCILDDPLPPPMCAEPFPTIPGLSILKPCPDWIAKIVADADAL